MARMLFEVGNQIILNPRDVDDRSLLTADADWLNDFTRYLNEHEYQLAELKRQRGE